MWMLSGPTASQSLANLQKWLDDLILSVCPGAIALDSSGHQLRGVYHQLRDNEADIFMSQLLAKLDEWGVDCHARGISCGKVLKTSSGTGRGQKVTHMIIGPFHD